ncbi:hypothetical protein QYF36_017603 [Acer negundo]|nr:hypothetical protein QYF36_017603 [Acer negundo]
MIQYRTYLESHQTRGIPRVAIAIPSPLARFPQHVVAHFIIAMHLLRVASSFHLTPTPPNMTKCGQSLSLVNPPCFWNDLQSGKKCYMILPKELYIMGIDDIDYDTIAWSRYSLPDLQYYFDYIPFGRSPEVVMCDEPEVFEIRGKISTSLLSPMTTYIAYLVFFQAFFVNIEDVTSYIEYSPIEVFVGIAGSNNGQRKTVYFLREYQDGDDNGFFPKKWTGLLENEFAIYSLVQSRVKNKPGMWESMKDQYDEEGLKSLNISRCTVLTLLLFRHYVIHFLHFFLALSGCLNLTSVHCVCAIQAHLTATSIPHPAH